MYYEKDIIDRFLHEKRTKLGTMNDVEIITSIEDFKKRFNDDYYSAATYSGLQMLTIAMAKAESLV